MEDLALVIEISWGSFASLFIVMISLSLITWLIGLIVQRVIKGRRKNKTEKELES